MKLVFATNNENKVKEIQKVIGDQVETLSLKDIKCMDEIPENQDTLEGNALEKSRYVHDKFKVNCFADDTGLEIEALENRPGVYSARYAGEKKDPGANMDKVLEEMQHVSHRKAKFRTVIALILEDKEYLFEGVVEGVITKEKKGKKGFGYDPIFLPDGYDRTFAEMDLDEKNTISHRARAVNQLVSFLKKL